MAIILKERKTIWSQLELLNRSMNSPWLVMGVFNTLLSVNDRINGNLVHSSEIADFQACVATLVLGQ